MKLSNMYEKMSNLRLVSNLRCIRQNCVFISELTMYRGNVLYAHESVIVYISLVYLNSPSFFKHAYCAVLPDWYTPSYNFSDLDQVAKASKAKITEEPHLENSTQLTRASKTVSVSRLWQGNSLVDLRLQTCILSYIGGSIVRKWRRRNKCNDCLSLVSNSTNSTVFFKHKQYKNVTHGLQKPSALLVNALSTLETIFSTHYLSLFSSQSQIIKRCFIESQSVYFPTPPCHPHLRDFF